MTEEATTLPTVNHTSHRECLACGYDLHGLGDDTRCPECGLLNIPQGYRQQVWDLVDSGKWSFSGFLHPLKKRLPGWWWALDRDGDLRRSYKFAVRNFIIASLIVLVSCYFANACIVKDVTRVMVRDTSDSATTWVEAGKDVVLYGVAMLRSDKVKQVDYNQIPHENKRRSWRHSVHFAYVPSWHAYAYALGFISWLVLSWGIPTFVGLITQLRKGMPDFARPQRTVLAACMYESHRLVYSACVIALLLPVEFVARYSILGRPTPSSVVFFISYILILIVTVINFGGLGWMGPLSSDYTKQLVRSRWHRSRIIIMYAIGFPIFIAFAAIMLITMIQSI